jgi:3,4-dihydroxy 2-butanone 4-phosphate synthase / GTP cyclohydrolase II
VTKLSIGGALEILRTGGRLVIQTADHIGAVAIAAEHADAEAIAFMAREVRGLITLCLPPERCAVLGLRPITPGNDKRGRLPMMVSIEARTGVTTGISAQDRARTIAVAVDPMSSGRDLVEPGHVIPLRAAADGVLERAGHAEAAIDLARLAGLSPAAVVCTVLGESGDVAEPRELEEFCARHRLRIVSIDDLVLHRHTSARFLERTGGEWVQTDAGPLWAVSFRDRRTGERHTALCHGDIATRHRPLVRIHHACLSGDVLMSRACACRERLEEALREVVSASVGVLVYLSGSTSCASQSTADGSDDIVTELLDDLRRR